MNLHNQLYKAVLCATVVIVCALALISCGTGGASGTQRSEDVGGALLTPGNEGQPPVVLENAPAVVGTLRRLPTVFSDGNSLKGGVNTGDAYYELPSGNNVGESVILKTDYATGKQSCLCQRSGCAHKEESCNAFVKTTVRQNMSALNGNLYISFGGFSMFQQTEEEKSKDALPGEEKYRVSYVDVIRMDGTSKRRLVEFPEGMYVTLCYCDDKALYGTYEIVEAQNGGTYTQIESGILRLNAETGEYTTTELPRRVEYCVGIYKNKLVYQYIAAEQDLEALMADQNTEEYNAVMESAVIQCYTIDPATGAREPLVTIPNAKTTLVNFVHADKLYYHINQFDESGLLNETNIEYYTIDLATGTQGTWGILPADLFLSSPLDGSCFQAKAAPLNPLIGCWGRLLNDGIIAYINAETREIQRVVMKTQEGKACMPLAQTNDGRWLINIGMIREGEKERYRYALIAPEDLFVENAKYTEIEPYVAA